MSPSVKILSVVSGVVKRFLPRFCALVIQSDPHLATAVGVTVFNEEDDAAFSRWAQSNWALKSRDFSPPAAGVMLQGGSREEKGQVGRSVRTEAPDVLGTPLLALRGPIWGCPLKLRTTDRQKETGTEVLQPQNWNLLTASTEFEWRWNPPQSLQKEMPWFWPLGPPAEKEQSHRTWLHDGYCFKPFWRWFFSNTRNEFQPHVLGEVQAGRAHAQSGSQVSVPCGYIYHLSIASLTVLNRFHVLSYSLGLTKL